MLSLAVPPACHGPRREGWREELRIPATPKVAVIDDWHGTAVADPWRWLELLDDPRTRAWASAQRAAHDAAVSASPLRDWLARRLLELGRPWDEIDASAAEPAGAAERVQLTSVDGDARVLVVREDEGASRVLLDPRRFGELWAIDRIDVAPDGEHVAVGLSHAGSDWLETRIVATADGALLPEVVRGIVFSRPAWARDGSGFLYTAHEPRADGVGSMLRGGELRWHRLGTPPEEDGVLYRRLAERDDAILEVEVSSDGRFAFLYEGAGSDQGAVGWANTRAWCLDLGDGRAPRLDGELRPLLTGGTSAGRVVWSAGSHALLLTDEGAPRRRLVEVDLSDPAPERWVDVLPEADGVLRSVMRVGRWIVAERVVDLQTVVSVHAEGGALERTLALPPGSSLFRMEPGTAPDELALGHHSYLRPPMLEAHSLAGGARRTLCAPAPVFDASAFVVERRTCIARDGTRLPFELVRRAELARDGSHPTLLYGYGSSGTMTLPWYGEEVLAWLELGGIFAVAHPRGGGEHGRAWYEAAILERKQTSFDDFLATAECLVAERWTSPERLAISGGSYGGLLVAAASTQRPELFAAALCEVPVTDMLRNPPGRHLAQYGSALDPRQFGFLQAYSPLHRVRPGVAYPATLITTALDDQRVPAWHAFKFAAALQEAQAAERPIVLRAEVHGGHFGGDHAAFVERIADEWTFLARALGIPDRPPSSLSE